EVDEPLPLYRGAGALAHPGQLLQQANRALSQNVALGPWIHAGSRIAHFGLARLGDRVTTRGRVARVFERKGHDFVELDLLLVAGEARPVVPARPPASPGLGGPPAASGR